MSVRQHPTKGPGWWQIRISKGRKGKDEYYTYKCSEAQAYAIEAELKGVPLESKDQQLQDVLLRFLEWYRINKAARTFEECQPAFRNILRIIGNKHITLLRQYDYDNYKVTRLGEGVSKKTINNELSYMRSLLNYCREELNMMPGDLPKLYPKSQTPPPGKTPLSPDEMSALLDQLKGDKKTIVWLYTWGGLRRSEALQLKVKNVDLQNRIITVTGKGNKTRIVSIIGDELYQGLEHAMTEWPRTKGGRQLNKNEKPREKGRDEYLFICRRTGKPYQNIKKSIKAAAIRAGIKKDVWNHLLRHSFGTAAILAGVNLSSLQEMMGHSDIRVTKEYIHMAEAIQAVEASKIAALQQNTAKPKKEDVVNVVNEDKQKAKVIPLHKKQHQ